MKFSNKIIVVLLACVFLLPLAIAADNETLSIGTFCCEKTTDGAWCQNTLESNCATGEFRKQPASCEATSYCQMGCCYNSQEGTCSENSPQKVCEEDGGVWDANANCEIPQCNLGCCLIGDQAAFVTLTRCKRLSNLYGMPINYLDSIADEFTCIASITSEEKGACVFEEEFEKTCISNTKKECSDMNDATFYEGRLCSDEKLGTTCAPSEKTTCVEGEDAVFFVDTCGNIANVYDASKIEDKDYWAKMYDVSESCSYGDPNSDSESCGNCDYFLGSTCKSYERAEDAVSPLYGDNICRDLSCEWEGETFNHGETWCESQGGVEESLVGSRDFRLVCYNGDVSIEPCADYRQETCIQTDVNGFLAAKCIVNKWQDCVMQLDQHSCENQDRRDCQWISGTSLGEDATDDSGACLPQIAPGFDFWNTEGDAIQICSKASTQCVVKYESDLFGNTECVENCECLEDSWESQRNEMCVSLGDCGSKTNFIGVEGYNNQSAMKVESYEEGDK